MFNPKWCLSVKVNWMKRNLLRVVEGLKARGEVYSKRTLAWKDGNIRGMTYNPLLLPTPSFYHDIHPGLTSHLILSILNVSRERRTTLSHYPFLSHYRDVQLLLTFHPIFYSFSFCWSFDCQILFLGNPSKSMHLSINLSNYLSNYLSIYLSIYLTVYLTIYLSYIFIHLVVCPQLPDNVSS